VLAAMVIWAFVITGIAPASAEDRAEAQGIVDNAKVVSPVEIIVEKKVSNKGSSKLRAALKKAEK